MKPQEKIEIENRLASIEKRIDHGWSMMKTISQVKEHTKKAKSVLEVSIL